MDWSCYDLYHQLQAESYSGTLLTDTFSGGTIDTERCFLTGLYKTGDLPEEGNLNSYVWYLKNQGYTVEGAHAGYEAFYNRLNVNANLGIPDYRFIEGYYENMVTGVPMDNIFLPDVTQRVLSAMESGPVFSFNVTYQNHGPYSADYAWFSDIYVPREGLDDSVYFIINNYLIHITKNIINRN